MNQEDVKVAFYLKKNASGSVGRCPVMGRLSVGMRVQCEDARTIFAVGRRVAPKAKVLRRSKSTAD